VTWSLTVAQAQLLSAPSASAAVAAWGFRYTLDALAVHVTQRPVVERERLDVDALLDIARSAAQGGRPLAVVRLLQSKACRQAIMFGDLLTRRECVALLRRLSHTRMPFRCAHGRVSVCVVAACVHDAAYNLKTAELCPAGDSHLDKQHKTLRVAQKTNDAHNDANVCSFANLATAKHRHRFAAKRVLALCATNVRHAVILEYRDTDRISDIKEPCFTRYSTHTRA
jgi:hypothetical protein